MNYRFSPPRPVLGRRSIPRLVVLLTLLGIAPLRAQGPARLSAEGFTLPNGLEVVLAPDRETQVVAVSVWYRAGSQDDPPARSGLARLFERQMFAGSANVPAGAHAAAVEDVGGRLSAVVDEERSRYTSTLPSNQVGLGLWLEAERMRSLAITDTSVAASQSGLLGEIASREDREPYAGALTEAIGLVYDSTTCPGFAHPALGRANTVAAITTADARAFYRQFYVPNNARLVVAGDFDSAAVHRQISDFFGGIPRGIDPTHPRCEGTSPAAAHLTTLTDRLADRLAVGELYRIPGRDHPDSPALDLLGIILSEGSGSRLRSVVVRGARAAEATQGGRLGERAGPGVFGLFAVAATGVSSDSLGAVLRAQTAPAAVSAFSEADLNRARNIYLATAIGDREHATSIAEALQRAPAVQAAADAGDAECSRIMAVSLSDLRRVAEEWLAPLHALMVIVTPETAP